MSMTASHQHLDSNVIPPMRKLPIAAWSITYGIHQDALVNYYDALVEHICLVHRYGKEYGISQAQLNLHDQSKWTKHEYPFYADRFWGTKEHNRKFISAMNHHYKHNMHHPEYWLKQGGEKVEMPRKFVMEMIADWKAASYQYTGSDNIQDWLNTKLKIDRFHPATLDLLRKELADIGYSL